MTFFASFSLFGNVTKYYFFVFDILHFFRVLKSTNGLNIYDQQRFKINAAAAISKEICVEKTSALHLMIFESSTDNMHECRSVFCFGAVHLLHSFTAVQSTLMQI